MKFFLFAVGIIALIAVLPRAEQKPANATPVKPIQQPVVESENEKEFQRYVGAINALKNGMKNPASFQLGQVQRMKSGMLCVTYRATNSFNAVVPGHAVIIVVNKAVISEKDGDWNKHCAGKAGHDWSSYIRPMI